MVWNFVVRNVIRNKNKFIYNYDVAFFDRNKLQNVNQNWGYLNVFFF